MMIKQKKIKQIESTLKEIYKEYKNKGILSIYLWGSVLTDDYNYKSSDIDSIAIVDKNARAKDNAKINRFLKTHFPREGFKLNYLNLDELNRGKIKSRLAKVIHPKLLLLDFKNCKLVIGKKYSRNDFKLKKINFDEAVQLNIKAVKKNHLPLLKRGDFKVIENSGNYILFCPEFSKGQFGERSDAINRIVHIPYFIKNLMKICYYLNQRDIGEHIFLYKELLKKSPRERKAVVRILLQIRKKHWDKSLTKKNLPILIGFIDSIG